MDTLNKVKMQEFRKEITAALNEVAKKHGFISLEATTGKYDSKYGCFSFALEGVVSGGLDKDAARYAEFASLYGWPEIFSEFFHNNKTYKVVGCNRTFSKIFCTIENGSAHYGFPAESVKHIFDIKRLREAAKKG